MAMLYGNSYTRAQLLERVGDISQVCEARRVHLADGSQAGVMAVEVKTGSGLRFAVLPGRGMDLGMADYKGMALSWRSSTGEVHPAFYDPRGAGMDRSYHGGLMHISGLTYSGLPCVDNGQELGLHGRASNLSAQNVYVDGAWTGDDYDVWVQGKLRETSALGENVLLTRRVWARLGESTIHIEDRVENLGHAPVEHMLLYHTNFGWPLLGEAAELVAPTIKVEPMTPEMAAAVRSHTRFEAPTHGAAGVLFYHDLACDPDGVTQYAVVNRSLGADGLGVRLRYSKRLLPIMVQWKMMGQGHYVLECGPANCRVDGRALERERGTLQFLDPSEVREYRLDLTILEGKEALDRCVEQIRSLPGRGA